MKCVIGLGLRSLSRRAAFANRRFGKAPQHLAPRQALQRAKSVSCPQPDLLEVLFGLRAGKLSTTAPPPKRRKRMKRRRRAKSKHGKGAFIPRVGETKNLPLVIRTTDRKLAFRPKASEEDPGNDVFSGVSDPGLRRLHYVLLVSSLRSLKEHVEIGSPRAAEIWSWIEREGQEEPFSFDACVLIAAELSVDPNFRDPFPDVWEEDDQGRVIATRRGVSVDFAGAAPEDLRTALAETLRRGYATGIPNHADVCRRMLMRADLGDHEALAWIDGRSNKLPSFAECCDALGFEPAHSGLPKGSTSTQSPSATVFELEVA